MTLEFKSIDKEWAIVINDTHIGTICLYNINREDLTSEWGFHIHKTEYKLEAYEREIVYKLLDYFFGQMKFEVLLGNTEILKQLGFLGKTADKYTKDDWLKYKGNEDGRI